MTTMRISEKGQVTLPSDLRRKYDLSPGTVLEVEAREDGILLRRVKSVRELKGILRDYAIPGMTWEKEREAAEQSMAEEAMGGADHPRGRRREHHPAVPA
jgi:AbrB family looped-hinge helix DNA binding protein